MGAVHPWMLLNIVRNVIHVDGEQVAVSSNVGEVPQCDVCRSPIPLKNNVINLEIFASNRLVTREAHPG